MFTPKLLNTTPIELSKGVGAYIPLQVLSSIVIFSLHNLQLNHFMYRENLIKKINKHIYSFCYFKRKVSHRILII